MDSLTVPKAPLLEQSGRRYIYTKAVSSDFCRMDVRSKTNHLNAAHSHIPGWNSESWLAFTFSNDLLYLAILLTKVRDDCISPPHVRSRAPRLVLCIKILALFIQE